MGILTTLSPKNVKHYLAKATTMPPHVFAQKAVRVLINELTGPLKKNYDRVLGTIPSDGAFLRKGFAAGYDFKDIHAAATHMATRPAPRLLISPNDREEIISLARSRFADDSERTMEHAGRSARHVFDLLGSEKVYLGEPIDWHTDFKTGFRWDAGEYFTEVQIPYGNGDIKVPWELSRFQHATALGQAYWMTGDERYSRAFVSQVSHWIESNPPRFGVNWVCPMDIAIRACNWITGMYFFRGSPELTPEFMFRILKSFALHATHIRGHLEYSEHLTSNHYLSDIAGLVCIGTMFPELKDAEEWKAFGIGELIHEMGKQVYPDGCDFEGSTCYHRLVLELFFYATLTAAVNDPSFTGRNYAEAARAVFGKEYTRSLYRMFEAVLYLLKPNGMMPQLGDNDSGRHHIFSYKAPLDMRYLLGLGAVFFNEPRFKVQEFGCPPDVLWALGPEGLAAWDSLKGITLDEVESRDFPDSGWYVLRDRKDYLLVSAGPNGQNGNGGHCHNDKLSIELCVAGRDIIVDPGTYVYTPEPEARNRFRSTAYHNTVQVNGLEQNSFPGSHLTLFTMKNEAHAHVTAFRTTEELDELQGEHHGFDEAGFGHQRNITYGRKEKVITIIDTITGDNPDAVARFHLAPGVEVKQSSQFLFDLPGCKMEFKGAAAASIDVDEYSPEYGKKLPSQKITVSFGSALKTTISIMD